MSSLSTPAQLTGKRIAPGLALTWRARLVAALIVVGLVPTLVTVYINHLAWWMALPPLVIAGLLDAAAFHLLIAPIVTLKASLERVQAGDFSIRSGIDRNDETGAIAAVFDSMVEHTHALVTDLESQRLVLENGIVQLYSDLAHAAHGDLTVHPASSDGPLGAVASVADALITRFGGLVNEVQHTAREISSGTSQVAVTVQQVSHEANKQAAALQKSARAIGDLAASASSVSERTQAAMQVSARALDAVRTGHDAVGSAQEMMGAIRDTTRRATRKVKGLGESAQLMSQALTLVQRNTEELHIMAGNASIEAARHAENGSIFRAVADGIEAVAEQSQLALRQIQDVIERNQRETVGVVEAIEDVTAQVMAGARTIHKANDAFTTVEGVVHELADLNVFIASVSAAQALRAVEVASMMGTLNGISIETSRNTATSAEATVRLRQLTEQLNGSVASLKAG